MNSKEHRKKVGGKWEKMGYFQLQLLKSYGLEKNNYLLDVGCGSLRGGIRFIDFLKDNHYYGVEKEKWLLEKGEEEELPNYGLEEKTVNLFNFSDFQFSQRIDQKFDFLLAQSVFTHIGPHKTEICIKETQKVMKKEAKFLATFWPGRLRQTVTHPHRSDEYKKCTYPIDWFQEESEAYSLEFSYEGEIGHPRGQHLLIFKKSS